MPKVNGRDIFETKPWLNDDPQNIEQYSEMVSASAPSGTIEISANGEYDVSEYATADVQVEGGGGSSDFSTATVTIIDPDECLEHFVGPCIENNEARTNFNGDPSEGIPVILFKGAAQVELTVTDGVTVETTGSVTTEAGSYIVTGDCTFTITDN